MRQINGPAVKLSEEYGQTIGQSHKEKINPNGPQYNQTLGDKNMAKAFVRHGPDALYAHIMKAAFDPVYGREMSIAREEEVKPAVRFPLAEEKRQHERSENLNSPAAVYSISEHPRFKPQNKQPGEKSKDDKPYQPYKQTYGKGYGASNVVVIYGQKAKSQKEKSIYSAGRNSPKAQRKTDYKVEFAANDNEKTKFLYERTTEFIAKTYDAVSKAVNY